MQKIDIPEPCSIPWNNMLPLEAGKRHCLSCQTPVVDFTGSSLQEIQAFFSEAAHRNVCGKYLERHTQQANRFQQLVSRVESFLFRSKLRKISLLLTGAVLIFASCRRHVQGKMSGYGYMQKKSDTKTQQHKR